MSKHTTRRRVLMIAAPIVLTLVSSTMILLLAGANPLEAFGHLLTGALESPRKLGDVVVAAPALCSPSCW